MMNNKEFCVCFLVLPAVIVVLATCYLAGTFYCRLVLLELVGTTALIDKEFEGF